MRPSAAEPAAEGLPRGLVLGASAVILLHLGAVLILVLGAPNGPWPTPDGPERFPPPQFAAALSEPVNDYLGVLKLTHNYHFVTNRHYDFAASLEVRLKDRDGNDVTVKFPDDGANFWVRHRQQVLANWFAEDVQFMQSQGEVIAAPGRQVPTIAIWVDGDKRGELVLEPKSVNELPRDQPVLRPTDVSLLLARSYARYLCRRYGATSAEVVRHSKPAIPPGVLFRDDLPSNAFEATRSDFGRYQPDKDQFVRATKSNR
jgi:hypothetical protein